MAACQNESAGVLAPCTVMAFPLSRRWREVRSAALTLAAVTSEDDADLVRHELAERLFDQLARLGLSEDEQDEEVGAFFHRVDMELEEMFDAALDVAPNGAFW